jgi:hypothetical protein
MNYFQPLDRFIYGMITREIDDSIVCCRFHQQKNNELKM